jgi:signal-transduction protein with cAMP-binding, CBS, and nucleotidyltransferase domain
MGKARLPHFFISGTHMVKTDTISPKLESLHGMQQFLAFLEPAETRQLLSLFRDTINQEIAITAGLDNTYQRLLASIPMTSDPSRLMQTHDELNSLEMERFLNDMSVAALHRNCTEYRDLLAKQSLRLVETECELQGNGPVPCPYALISMGSDGREEQTLITDQDYLIVYANGFGEDVDRYFTAFSELLMERMADIGFKKCTGGIMPSNPTWRGSLSQWNRRLLAIVRYEFEDYAKNLMDLIVLSDARYVSGDRDLANQLIATIRGLQQDYFQVLWGMAKAATEMKLALGFLKRLWTEGSGEHKGEFNLKLLAWAPLVMNIRILAINRLVAATNTVQRIEQLQQDRSISATMAKGLITAYLVLTKHRILLQIKVIKGIQNDSYHLNPYHLPTEEREQIRQALLRIEELQKMIHINFSIV